MINGVPTTTITCTFTMGTTEEDHGIATTTVVLIVDLVAIVLVVLQVILVQVTRLDISVTLITRTIGVTIKDGTTIVMIRRMSQFTTPAIPTAPVAMSSGISNTVIHVSTPTTMLTIGSTGQILHTGDVTHTVQTEITTTLTKVSTSRIQLILYVRGAMQLAVVVKI